MSILAIGRRVGVVDSAETKLKKSISAKTAWQKRKHSYL